MEELDQFLRWCESQDIEANRVTVGQFGEGGIEGEEEILGLKALGDITEDDPLVKVPRKAIFSTDVARQTPSLKNVRRFPNNMV